MGTIPGTEAGLIESARGGDDAAFDALVGPLIEPAYKLAVVMLRDSQEAQDAVQETCFKAWTKLPQLRQDSPMRPWFLAILANHCRTVRRTRWWSVVKVPSIRGREDFPGGEIDSDLDLNRALGKLSATDRAALFLFFSLDVPLVEVARILKISPQAAKSRVHRAVVKLRLNMVEVAG
ncbi:MAG TPA: RNA polymerase sigma factor [Candidatus Dormibacteraeota bacterium]|nr:RNA polymerase sigma factor [Candidatus Dormibacteraeota bacterium]